MGILARGWGAARDVLLRPIRRTTSATNTAYNPTHMLGRVGSPR